MTGPSPDAPTGDDLPEARVAGAGNGSGAPAIASHAIAAARAQAAAEARAHVYVAAEHATPDYTGLVTRAIAFGLDAAFINIVAAGVGAIIALALNLLQVPSKVDTALTAVGAVAYILWSAAYFVTFWSTTGQTPGARIMRFRVLDPAAQLGHIGPGRAIVRLIAMTLAAIPLLAGYFMVLFDDRRRGLHDRLAHTVVIDAPESETPTRRMRARRQAPPA